MAGLKNIFFILVVVLSTVFLTDASRATEVIKSYDSDIIVEPNGDLMVTETIAIIASFKTQFFYDFVVAELLVAANFYSLNDMALYNSKS